MTGKLLQGGDDDRPASFEGIPELAGGLVNVLHHAEGLLELPDGSLQLAVEYPSIRHHDHGVEDASVFTIMEHRKLVGKPSNGEALPATGRVLD